MVEVVDWVDIEVEVVVEDEGAVSVFLYCGAT